MEGGREVGIDGWKGGKEGGEKLVEGREGRRGIWEGREVERNEWKGGGDKWVKGGRGGGEKWVEEVELK